MVELLTAGEVQVRSLMKPWAVPDQGFKEFDASLYDCAPVKPPRNIEAPKPGIFPLATIRCGDRRGVKLLTPNGVIEIWSDKSPVGVTVHTELFNRMAR